MSLPVLLIRRKNKIYVADVIYIKKFNDVEGKYSWKVFDNLCESHDFSFLFYHTVISLSSLIGILQKEIVMSITVIKATSN